MNPFDLLKNPQVIQEQREKAQAQLEGISATGSSGGNMVQITVNGKMQITGIKLDPLCVDNRDIPMLQDLIIAAHHDAMDRIQQEIKNRLGPMLGGLQLPGMGA